jgi:hypothetical protein
MNNTNRTMRQPINAYEYHNILESHNWKVIYIFVFNDNGREDGKQTNNNSQLLKIATIPTCCV